MKKHLLNCLIILSAPLMASEDFTHCNDQFTYFGKRKIQASCIETFKENLAGLKNKKEEDYHLLSSPNALILILGHKVHTQAGEYSQVDSPLTSAYSSSENLLATLQPNGLIKIYDARIMGNTAPIKVFEDPRFYGARDIAFTHNGLLLLNPKTKKVLFLDHTKKVNKSLKQNPDIVIREYGFSNDSIKSISYDPNTQEILLTDLSEQVFTIKL